jgi:hypothetical protein
MPSHKRLVPLGTARNPLGTAASQTHLVLGLFFNKALLNDTQAEQRARKRPPPEQLKEVAPAARTRAALGRKGP